MRYALLLFVCLSAYAQEGPTIAISEGGPTNAAYQHVYGYSSSNLVYTCTAVSVNSTRTGTRVAVSAATNANPVVFTSTGHGFAISSRPKVTLSGGTGSWTATNGAFTATVIDANTFSIPVDSTAFGALAGTVVFTTAAPRATVADWSVKLYAYDGSSNLIWSGWQNSTNSFNQKCSDAALTTTNRQ